MYKMRFRSVVRLVTTPGTPSDTDAALISVGDLDTDTVNPISKSTANGVTTETFATPSSVVLKSVSQALSHIVGVNDRIQRAGLNVRFEVWGKPVGYPEGSNPALTGDQLKEKCYVQGDTPDAGLIFAMLRANAKPKSVVVTNLFPNFSGGVEVGVAETSDPSIGNKGGPGNAAQNT